MTDLIALQQPSCFGTLIKRYKRFLCDIELEDGRLITAHCPNPGRMTTCSEPGSRVRLTVFDDPKRKYAHRVDLIHNGDCWIGVNPNLANEIVAAAIQSEQLLPELKGQAIQREVAYHQNKRIDFFCDHGDSHTYIEVKSVTYAMDGVGYFPDAVSKRASEHLIALSDMSRAGHRAIVVYCIQRSDIANVLPAQHIDPKYASESEVAAACGVEFLPLAVTFDRSGAVVRIN